MVTVVGPFLLRSADGRTFAIVHRRTGKMCDVVYGKYQALDRAQVLDEPAGDVEPPAGDGGGDPPLAS